MPKAKAKSSKSQSSRTSSPAPSSIHFIKAINLSLSTTSDCFTYFSSYTLNALRSALLLSTENFSDSSTPLQIGSGLLAVSSPLPLPEFLASLNSSNLVLDGKPLHFVPSSLPSIPPASLEGLSLEEKSDDLDQLVSTSFDSPSSQTVSKILSLTDFPLGISFPSLFDSLSKTCSVNDLRYRPGGKTAYIRLGDENEYEGILKDGLMVEGKKVTAIYPEWEQKTFSNRNKVYISGFGNEVTSDELKEAFLKHGKVIDVKIHEKYESTGKRIYGFVVFENEDDARKVIDLGRVEMGSGDVLTSVAKDGKDRRVGDRLGDRRGRGGFGFRGNRRFGGYR